MQEAVSEILIDRAREADGMGRMVGVSVLAHAVMVALVVIAPASWLSPPVEEESAPMMISLGGTAGPDVSGSTPISGRTVQTVAEPEAKPRVETPPAATPPEMVAPTIAKPTPRTPPKPVEKPADKSTAKTPTSGAEVRTGASKVDTGAPPIPFGGLASGGGQQGDAAFTDYANFCCPQYLRTMTDLIKRNWNQNQGAAGQVQMKFIVRRDGTMTGIEVEKSSGQALLDQASQRALLAARLPPLPREFPDNTLTVHLIFEYKR